MTSQKEKDILLNIIDIYKDMPCLWNKNHTDYKNKSARYDGYRVLLEIYKNFDPEATIKTLKKKIENMKTTFLREAKKVTASKHTGAGTEDIYVPSLWYFEAISFLGSTTEPCRPMKDSLENENSTSSDEERSQTGSSSASTVPVKKKKKKTFLQKQEDLIDTAGKLMSLKEEEWEVLGKSIGFQLRDLKKRELTIAQKLIGDVIYYAKIGRLTEDARITLVTSFPSPALSSNASSSSYSTSSYHNNNRNRVSYTPPQYNVQTPQTSPQYLIQASHPSPQYIVQTSDPLPQQHLAQTPNPSPQYNVQEPNPSPQYQVRTPQPSPQYHIQPSHPSPQYNEQTSEPLTQHSDQTPQSSLPYQLEIFDPPRIHIPNPLQYQLLSLSQQRLSEKELQEASPAHTSHQHDQSVQPLPKAHSLQENTPTARTARINIKEYLVFNPNK